MNTSASGGRQGIGCERPNVISDESELLIRQKQGFG